MKTARIALVALLCAAPGAAPQAHADVRDVFTSFVQGLTVRMGVAHDSLVVLPLVREEVPVAATPSLAVLGGVESWQRLPESQVLVDVSAPADAPAPDRFVAAGTLLLGDVNERIVPRAFPLRADERVRTASVVCDSRRKPADAASPLRVGRIAPFEQRKLMLVGRHDDSLGLVQRIQSIVAGLPETAETVSEVLESKYCADVERAVMADLGKIPKAYAGRAVGHVAFFGYRPVEVVAFARPADYQALGPAYLRSLAVSHAFWAELLGGAAARSADDEMRRLVAEGTAVVESFARANPHQEPGVQGERSRWKTFAGAAESDMRAGQHTEQFVFRCAVDEKGGVAHLYAVESGSDLVYPPPYREPGGRPVGEPPSNKGNTGGMTVAAMERLLDRMLERRQGR